MNKSFHIRETSVLYW